MVILLVIKDLMLHELNELIEANKLQSVSEYMNIQNVLNSPPSIYPYSVFSILTGKNCGNFCFDLKKTKSLFDLYSNSLNIKANYFNKLESLLSFDPIKIDKKTWSTAIEHIEDNKIDFICITLESLHQYNALLSKKRKEMSATFYYFIDHIVHTLYNLIPNIKPTIIISGSGKIIKNKNKLTLNKIDNSKSYSPIPGLLLLKAEEDKLFDIEQSKTYFSQGIELIAFKNKDICRIVFAEGELLINYGEKILEIKHIGSNPLLNVPEKLTRREVYQFTRFSEYPELFIYIEDIFKNFPTYNVIISNMFFHVTNLEMPIMINDHNININKTSEIFDLIKNKLSKKV